MAQQVFDKFLNWFSENVSVELSDDEKKELKEVLEENEFDEEMLDFANEGDFKSIIPQNWCPKKRFFLMKAFKHLKGQLMCACFSFPSLDLFVFPSLIFVLFYCLQTGTRPAVPEAVSKR